MKTRPISKLLQILDKELLEATFFSGLCFLIKHLFRGEIITSQEYYVLLLYIRKHKPATRIKDFPYWWPKGEKEPRHQFLEKLIKKEQRWNRLLQVLRFWESWRW